MAQYVWEIDQKQELIELADNHFYDKSDFYDSISATKTCVNEHLNDKENEKNLSLNMASKLIGIVNEAEPIYDLEDALDNSHVEQKTWAGEERVELDPSYREFIFKGYTLDELQEITEEDRDSLINYRTKDRSIPQEAYLKVFENLQSRYSEKIELEGDLHLIGGEKENSKIISDVSASELREIDARLKKLRNLERKNPKKFGYLVKNIDKLKEELKIKLDKGVTTYKPDKKSLGQAAAALDDVGYLGGPWSKTYEMMFNPEELDMIARELPSKTSNDEYSDEQLLQIIEDNFEERNDKLQDRLRKDSDLPSPQTYRNHFGDLTNAFWRAEIDKEEPDTVDKDIIIDQLLEATHRQNKVPNPEEFYNMEDTVSDQTVRNYFDENGFDQLVRQAGLESKRKIQNSIDQGDKYYVDKNR